MPTKVYRWLVEIDPNTDAEPENSFDPRVKRLDVVVEEVSYIRAASTALQSVGLVREAVFHVARVSRLGEVRI